jgi:DNA-binding transcriptional regulator YdaS (Cro superfamily)
MDLKTYLSEFEPDRKVTRAGSELKRLADACGVSTEFLYQFALGHRVVSSELACHLEYATEGRVNRRDSLPDFPWDRPVEKVRAVG